MEIRRSSIAAQGYYAAFTNFGQRVLFSNLHSNMKSSKSSAFLERNLERRELNFPSGS